MDQVNKVGRRKASVARVFLKKGKGDMIINNKQLKEYFPIRHLQLKVLEPLEIVQGEKDYDIMVNVHGGGIKGQAEAIRLGIGRALCEINQEFRPQLKSKGILKRDARAVERKKAGLKKARKKTQYSKR